MRIVRWLAALLLMVPAGRNAQQASQADTGETQTAGGLHSVTFRLPQGTVRAFFPDDLAAGDVISGTVLADPAGATEAARQANAGELNGYVVDIGQRKTPVAEKTFRWQAPPEPGTALVVLRDTHGVPVAESSIPVSVPGTAGSPRDFDLPTTGVASAPVTARGPFDGDLRTTVVSVGGDGAPVLAESPRKIVFQPPAGRPGISTLEIRKGDRTASAPFRTIELLLRATRINLPKGQTAILTVTVLGLKNLAEPADLILFNRSPAVVTVEGGVEQRFTINPSKVRPDGSYVLVRTLTGIMAGGFNIIAVANRQPTLQFNLARTVASAVLDWQQSTGVSITTEAQHSIAASVMKDRKPLDDFLRAQEAYRGDPASITDTLVRNYCFDLRDRRSGIAGAAGERTARLAFLPPQAARPKLGIDAQDVSGFSFGRFLSQLLGWLSPNQPVAYLSVSSRPDQAPITVDNHAGPDRTNRKFLVSAGKHSVVVTMTTGLCSKSILVQPFQTGTVACL
jgi:hypothetical protein